MFLSELNIKDKFCLEHLGIDSWKVIEKETIPYGFTEETFYRILNSLTNEVRVIENPDEIEVFHVLPWTDYKSAKLFIKVKRDTSIDTDILKNNMISEFPIGVIHKDFFGKMEESEGWLFSNGRAIKKEEYPELYSVMGDTYSIEEKIVETPTLMERVLNGFVGRILKPKTIKQRNCGEDKFRIPDLRGRFLR